MDRESVMSKSETPGLKTRRNRGPARADRKRAPGLKVWLLEAVKTVVGGLLIFLVIRTLLLQTFTIISGSMERTLLIGDFLLVSKAAYGATIPGTRVQLPGYEAPERGDIVVFRGPHEPIDLVKRLVGLPGDTLAMRDGILLRNGVPQAEPYVLRTPHIPDGTDARMLWQLQHAVPSPGRTSMPTRDNWGPLVVPRESYFMLGDNRDMSLDSRYWGFVPGRNLKGRAVVLYFSINRSDRAGVLDLVRWSRIGHVPR